MSGQLDQTRRDERLRMVEDQLLARGITHEGVLRAMRNVPRHAFVPDASRAAAYEDRPLPIGHGQTISQPYMVATMTEALDLDQTNRVFEIGTGCGYQAAVLAQLSEEVISFEWVSDLATTARDALQRLGIDNVRVCAGDGSSGLKDGKLYDRIIVTAGAPQVPPEILAQLADRGRLVIPLGSRLRQELTVFRRIGQRYEEERREGCVFVPLQGRYGW
jgi:protein-L-isoaspartate(D-aspartate) O-methyltransferase